MHMVTKRLRVVIYRFIYLFIYLINYLYSITRSYETNLYWASIKNDILI